MPHRFPDLQNEFGKPVIVAGDKKPLQETDFIDISWLDTTDGTFIVEDYEDAPEDKVVISQTLTNALGAVFNKIEDSTDEIKEVAVQVKSQDYTLSQGKITLPEGETFINCFINFSNKLEQVLPGISLMDNNQIQLDFGDEEDNSTIVKVTTLHTIQA